MSVIYSKLVMRVFDVYVNILKYMYNTRFSGGPTPHHGDLIRESDRGFR
jgi:hypothetical protein